MNTSPSLPPSSEVEEAAFQDALRLADGLFPHQVEGVAFLLGRRRAILADDMGLGKTRQSIVALRHAEPGGPYLVVCPASVKRNWEKEILLAHPEARCRVLQGATDAPLDEEIDGWVIVNYDILGKRLDELKAVGWKGIVFDEAHYLKNHNSQRNRHAMSLLADESSDPVVHALTGTPLTNRPRDLFPLLQLVRHSMGRSFLTFAKRYCEATHNGYGWVTDGASNLEELTAQLHGIMLRRRKEEVLDLPPKVRTWLPVEVPAGTATTEIREVVETLLASAVSGQPRKDRVRLLAKITKAREKMAAAKADQTISLLTDILAQGEKAIVFSCFDRPLKAFAKRFGEECVLLTGATPTEKRQALVDRFQNDDSVRLFVANLQAGGVGINLTAARQVVFNDLDWVPANHWQAEDRAYRIGQTGTVNVHYLVARGTIDEFVEQLLATKTALVEAVTEGQALGPGATRDVLSELEHLLSRLSARIADPEVPLTDEEWVEALLKEVEHETAETGRPAGPARNPVLGREALLALARVLTRPAATVYRAVSKSDPSKAYTLTYESSEVTCSCPGFEYRGTCSHAKTLKTALDGGKPAPPGYEAVVGDSAT
jgi:SWI/SNF-related matrix-associated actin-dependent regulator 1 of chromatin subfamily A